MDTKTFRLIPPSNRVLTTSERISLHTHRSTPLAAAGIDVLFSTFKSEDSAFGSSYPPPFQSREDSSSYTLNFSPSSPSFGNEVTSPTFEQKEPTKRDKLPATQVDVIKIRRVILYLIYTGWHWCEWVFSQVLSSAPSDNPFSPDVYGSPSHFLIAYSTTISRWFLK